MFRIRLNCVKGMTQLTLKNALLRRKHRGDIKKSRIILNLIFSAEDIRCNAVGAVIPLFELN